MTNILDATADFMTASGQTFANGLSDLDLRKLRRNLLAEEVEEYFDGEDRDDPVEIADGLADMIVIAYGTLLAYFGEDAAREVCREVFRSNLAKIGEDGTVARRDDGKILKPEGWKPPDIRRVLAETGFIEGHRDMLGVVKLDQSKAPQKSQ
ncbi:MazG-like nucleotide pyrophosphohydrolase [Mycobacterium phage Thonko]|uniref:MazG-like nucleotide pyrophosphohydrolase n=1 Tax=Mycobacterium phage Thonko TaxID=2282910 RepID=A0A346FCA2_9CAUD|nr:MazG-like pyrophosphatase [Mycobacterium phage Thonko]AXN53327.1 MazG-like nucleotide pyrophosphohydrolase [Mycobacterium phage Thonko]